MTKKTMIVPGIQQHFRLRTVAEHRKCISLRFRTATAQSSTPAGPPLRYEDAKAHSYIAQQSLKAIQKRLISWKCDNDWKKQAFLFVAKIALRWWLGISSTGILNLRNLIVRWVFLVKIYCDTVYSSNLSKCLCRYYVPVHIQSNTSSHEDHGGCVVVGSSYGLSIHSRFLFGCHLRPTQTNGSRSQVCGTNVSDCSVCNHAPLQRDMWCPPLIVLSQNNLWKITQTLEKQWLLQKE